jgi:hypothetical protein
MYVAAIGAMEGVEGDETYQRMLLTRIYAHISFMGCTSAINFPARRIDIVFFYFCKNSTYGKSALLFRMRIRPQEDICIAAGASGGGYKSDFVVLL